MFLTAKGAKIAKKITKVTVTFAKRVTVTCYSYFNAITGIIVAARSAG